MSLPNPEMTRRQFTVTSFYAMVMALLGLSAHPSFRKNSLSQWKNYEPPTGLDWFTCLVYADTHLGDPNEDKPRLTTSITEPVMEESVLQLKDLPINLVAHLGDMIANGPDHMLNMIKFQKMLAFLQQFPWLLAPMLGNHDRWGLTERAIQTVVDRQNFTQPFYGVIPCPNIDTQIVYLDTKARYGRTGYVPDESLELIEKNVYKDTRTVVMGHYSTVPFPDSSGHPYPHIKTAYANWQEVMALLRGKPIRAIFHGHTHMYHENEYAHRDNYKGRPIPIIGLPAFAENLVSTQEQYNPGIYTMLLMTKQHIDIKIAHRGTVFAQPRVYG